MSNDIIIETMERDARVENKPRESQGFMLGNPSMPQPFPSIESYVPDSPEHRLAFASLNREWLDRYFRVEAEDEHVMADPEGFVLADGGEILFARMEGKLVGTVTLLQLGDGDFELAKMAVAEAYQGRGIGRTLGEALLVRARARGIDTLYITSNTKLVPAINLYRALGFTDSPAAKHLRYERGDITLEKKLR